MKKPLIFISALLILSSGLLYHIIAPRGTTITFSATKPSMSVLTIPLDSRPPCSDFTAQLGHLAGINVILPPGNLLDKYEIPAQSKAISVWMQENIAKTNGAIISVDLLAHGGLLNSRLQPLTQNTETEL